MKNKKSTQIIQSFATGIMLLDIIIRAKKPLSFNEIQELSSLKTSNLYKYLATLIEAELLEKKDSLFIVGPTFSIWKNDMSESTLIDKLTLHLKDFSQLTNLTALIAIPTVEGPLITHIHQATFGVNIGAQIGHHLPLHSSTGMIQQAFDNTQSHVNNLVPPKDLQQVRKNKFIQLDEPLVSHISSCSLPILVENDLTCMLTFVGFTPSIPTNQEDAMIQSCIHLVEEIIEK